MNIGVAVAFASVSLLVGVGRTDAAPAQTPRFDLHACIVEAGDADVSATRGAFDQSKCGERLVLTEGGLEPPAASSGKYIVVWVSTYADATHASLTFGDAGISEITLREDGAAAPLDNERYTSQSFHSYQMFFSVPLSGLRAAKLSNGDDVSLDVTTNDGPYQLKFRYRTPWDPYGLAGPIWLPIGLFGTHFESDSNGLKFAAFPISIAVGERYYVTDGFYLGGALTFSWAFYGSTDASGMDQGTSLESFAFGGLIDLDNYVYLGVAYGHDFRKLDPEPKQPGVFLVVGAAPGLLKVLQGGPK